MQCLRQLRGEAFVSGGTEFSGRIVTLFCGYLGVKTFLTSQTPVAFANDGLFVDFRTQENLPEHLILPG